MCVSQTLAVSQGQKLEKNTQSCSKNMIALPTNPHPQSALYWMLFLLVYTHKLLPPPLVVLHKFLQCLTPPVKGSATTLLYINNYIINLIPLLTSKHYPQMQVRRMGLKTGNCPQNGNKMLGRTDLSSSLFLPE